VWRTRTPFLVCHPWILDWLQSIKTRTGSDTTWRTDTTNQRGGEWMGADKNSSRRRGRLKQDEHGFQHTSPTHYPNWPSPHSQWSASEPTNQLPISQTRECSGTPNLESTDQHLSDRWAPPVRPVPAGETWRLPQSGSTPVRLVQHTGLTGLS
jgi:hypothetical protein